MRLHLSVPVAVGYPDLPLALSTSVSGVDIKRLVGRKNLLGLRGEALAAVGLAELARVVGGDWGVSEEVSVIACTSTASDEAVGEVYSLCLDEKSRTVSILDAPNVSPNVVSSVVSIRLGARGPCLTLDDAGGQAESALDIAAVLLGSGRARTVIALETDGVDSARGVAFVLTGSAAPEMAFEISWDHTSRRTGLSLYDLAQAAASTLRSRSGIVQLGNREIRSTIATKMKVDCHV